MVILKNQSQTFHSHDFVESFLKSKEPDCTLYSEEGMKYNIHKEIFYQTQFMRNIFETSNAICCKEKEIFCPCSGDELESMVNFLYNGRASSLKVTDIAKILDNLTRIFGFPENLFSLVDCSLPNKSENLNLEGKSNNLHEKTKDILDENVNENLSSGKSIVEKATIDTLFVPNDEIPKNSEVYINLDTNQDQDKSINKTDSLFFDLNPKETMTLNRSTVENDTVDTSFIPDNEILMNFEMNPNLGKSIAETDTVFLQLNSDEILTEKSEADVLNLNMTENTSPVIISLKNKKVLEFGNNNETLELSNHAPNSHEEKKPFQCTLCEEDFKTKYFRKCHMNTVHEGKKPYKCSTCKDDFSSRKDLKIHVYNTHYREKIFQCVTCDENFNEKKSLKIHIAKLHQNMNPDLDQKIGEHEKKYPCAVCNLNSKTLYERQCHMIDVHDMEKKKVYCDVCGGSFPSNAHLKNHTIAMHERNKPFQCNRCDKRFNWKSLLRGHNSLPHTFQCNSCDKTFIRKVHLDKHFSSNHA